MVAKVTWPFFTISTYLKFAVLNIIFSVAAYFHYSKRRLVC